MTAEMTAAERPANTTPPLPNRRDASDAAQRDETTLEFKGRIAITDEDIGGDPYNHTGRFRRVVR